MDSMIIQLGLFALGFLFLSFGADWMVSGSSRLASALGIKRIVIGLTIVAFGTSSPELVVSLSATVGKNEGIAIGNIIGSNIANIGLILGTTALISPVKVGAEVLRRELPVMIAASLLFVVLLLDQNIGFFDGLLLFSGLLAYLGYHLYKTLRTSRTDKEISDDTADDVSHSGRRNVLLIIVGLLLLIAGGQLIVTSGVFIARKLGISELIIGLTLVSIGTSLPELATSIASARRKESEICLGNIIGSNIFNLMCVIGIVAMVTPLEVPKGLLTSELPVMLLFTLVLIPIMRTGFVVNRIEGAILLFGYGIFIKYLF